MVVQQNIGGANVTAMFERGDAVTWQARSEQQHPYSLGSLRLDRGFGPLKLDIGLGLLREEDTLLGSSLGPVFGISGATTRLADARAEMNFSRNWRSDEHTSELQSLLRISYAVFCLNKKKYIKTWTISTIHPTSDNSTFKITTHM